MKSIQILKQMYNFSPCKIKVLWLLDSLEIGFISAWPFFLGKAIDSVIDESIFWLVIFILIEIAMLILGAINKYLDTRVYADINNEFHDGYFIKFLNTNVDISIVDARIELIDDFSGFLENAVINIFSPVIGIIASLLFLFLNTSFRFFFLSIIISVFVLIIELYFQKKTIKNNKEIKNHKEQRHNILRMRSACKYKGYVNSILSLVVDTSDKDAFAYLFAYAIQIVLIGYYLCVMIWGQNIMPGLVFSTFTYIVNLNTEIMDFPNLIFTWRDLIDSGARLDV